MGNIYIYITHTKINCTENENRETENQRKKNNNTINKKLRQITQLSKKNLSCLSSIFFYHSISILYSFANNLVFFCCYYLFNHFPSTFGVYSISPLLLLLSSRHSFLFLITMIWSDVSHRLFSQSLKLPPISHNTLYVFAFPFLHCNFSYLFIVLILHLIPSASIIYIIFLFQHILFFSTYISPIFLLFSTSFSE